MNHVKYVAVTVLAVFLTACGQKGPLYLPQDETPDIKNAEGNSNKGQVIEVQDTELSISTAEPSAKDQTEEELKKALP